MRPSAAAAPAPATANGPPPPPLSPLLADALLEFLEAAVHTVLHARGLYPQEVFERRRLYGSCLCPRARHPGVCAYVASALAALRPPLVRGALQEVVVVMREEGGEGAGREGRALEKVSFALHRSAAAAAAVAGAGTSATDVPLPDAGALEAAFAAALVKLQHLSQAPPLRAAAAAAAAAAAGARGIGAGGGGKGTTTPAAAAPPLPRGATFEIVGLATSREGVDRSALMEEDALEAGASVLLPVPRAAGATAAPSLAGWPIKTVRLFDGSGGGSGAAATATAATLTILVEAALA
jgi:hypothetical protein